MSKLQYTNVSLNQPQHSRDIKGDDDIFLAELKSRKTGGQNDRLMYRPGQAPAWAENESSEEEDADLLTRRRRVQEKLRKKRRNEQEEVERSVDVKGESIPRRERRKFVAEIVADDAAPAAQTKEEEEPAAPAAPRVFDTSNLEVQELPSSEEEEEESEEDSRRARARARFKQKQQEEAQAQATVKQEEDEEEEGDSEYETDTSDEEEDYPSRPLLKPTFVSKKDRETIAERERLEAEKEQEDLEAAKREKQRKKESRQLVVEDVKREEEAAEAAIVEGSEELPDDNDDVNEEEELEKWKIRELKRIKRDKEKLEQEAADLAAKERRKNMTDAEVEAENLKKPQRKIKGDMRYLQKYYHRGAFYQDETEKDQVWNRDFMAPTGEDRTVDKSLLPQVLQVKKFGLKSRTKYTHLTDQDTSARDVNPWASKDAVQKRKLAGEGKLEYTKKRAKPSK
mmetsp:Transcript_15848/g.31028  ORF Transcript_15848/g.31028 Transcript_15848/m.31028 type:complete len:454 (-) Transcript_15848:190-1551(-)|eukprot:CAMPEP_0175148446 /NCGR_PEP_ID=MMETSP0087-20121206/16630_1 /TAXON_ID=136419 /ORGANISM="Unknown Unknown, Strain D1" /LENGTH=453 /DNA_ID=CAMNT_0016433903 /DNA_START=120 /DNA_END=1481 /DNA_ORIENTATION=-